MTSPSLSEDTLRKLGGWQALQEARRIFELGGVRSLDSTAAGEGMLTGNVLVGGTERRVVLRWKGDREAGGACSCPAARRGVLCAHALALGVAACRGLAPMPELSAKITGATGINLKSAISVNKESDKLDGNAQGENASIHIKAASGLRKSWENKSLPILFQRVEKKSYTPESRSRPDGRVNALESRSDAPARDGVGQADLLAWLNANVGRVASVPPALRLEGEAAGRFLAWLADRQDVLEAPDGTWLLSGTPWRPSMAWRAAHGDAGCLLIQAAKPAGLTVGPGGWLMLGQAGGAVLCPSPDWSALPPPFAKSLVAAAVAGGSLAIEVARFLRVAPALEGICELTGDEHDFSIDDAPPRFAMEIDGSAREMTCRLLADYGVCTIALPCNSADAEQFPRALPEKTMAFRERNPVAEAAALALLARWGFRLKDESDKTHRISGENVVLTFYAGIGRLVPSAWELRFGARWSQFLKSVEVAKFQFQAMPSSPGWLEGEVACSTGTGTMIPRADIQRLLRSGRGYFNAKGGKTVVLDLGVAGELEEVWQDMDARQVAPGRFRFDALQARYLKSVLGHEEGEEAPLPPLDEVSAGPGIEVLRPYQRHGVAWLAGQCRHGLGALLADDMGLGKTLQTLIFLEWQRRQGGEGPALVVCPTSLLSNWQDESARFCPDWQVLVHHGASRKDYWDVMDAADLVLTTYGLLARDIETFRARSFRTVVLDEASLIRNPDAGIAKAAHTVEAGMRLALTGTPVENSARDLWSLMQFVQPGYLGSRQDFRQRYELPMAGATDNAGLAGRLQKRLRPFVLRRLKAEVAADLPSRLEKIEWCAMDDGQAELYNSILRESREKISQSIQQQGFANSRMSVLTALLRLRQVCCDPGLVMPEKFAGEVGGKREAFRELMREALEGGHRVLVFSQFVTMLGRLKEDVEALGVECGWLTGGSRDRGEQVRRFQDGGAPVFLLSLKAGGYGLTLTTADTVILYDPWWNPAVESQAIDRAHRIGQNKVVTAYRLAARGTVEEKILKLQEKKRGLAAQMIADPGQMMDGLGESDLRELLGI